MILRVVVTIALGAAMVRVVGASVGAWAAGSLDPSTTIFVGVVAPAWILVFLPTWLGWRIVGPRRAPRLLGALCWLSPLVRARDLPSVRLFLDVASGRAFPPPPEIRADAWTALGAALQAERQGNIARAAQILEALAYLPEGSRFPWLARVWAVEALAASAVGRRDWAAVSRYVALGRGRLVRLYALVAEAQAGRPVRASELWWSWALAPARRANRRLVDEVLARRAAPGEITPAPAVGAPAGADAEPGADANGEAGAAVADARLRHLRMLGAAAQGARVPMREVLALAAAWQRQLDEAALARLHARALELDARGGAEQARAVRDVVLDELAALAETAEGVLPPEAGAAGGGGGAVAGELVSRVRDRLFLRVEEAVAALDGGGADPAAHPIDAWERWLGLRAALERVEQQAGRVALTALWHGGVRNAVWNWIGALYNADRARAAWAAHIVFTWLADVAEVLGDLSASISNRENARVAREVAS